jgi:hypothetical protein
LANFYRVCDSFLRPAAKIPSFLCGKVLGMAVARFVHVGSISSARGAVLRQTLRCAGDLHVVVAGMLAVAALTTSTGSAARAIAVAMLVPVIGWFVYAAARSAARMSRALHGRRMQASVRRELLALGKAYRILSRLSLSADREDYVAIGPNGVFVIVSCGDSGRVTAATHGLFINARRPWRDFLDDCRSNALGIRERVRRGLGRPLPVYSVLCFARALVAVGQEIQGVKIVHASRLVRLIASTPVTTPLSSADIDAAVAALTAQMQVTARWPVRRFTRSSRPPLPQERRLTLVGRATMRQHGAS